MFQEMELFSPNFKTLIDFLKCVFYISGGKLQSLKAVLPPEYFL